MEPDRVAEEDLDRDRLGVHAVWEAVLLIAVGVAAALVWDRSTAALSGDQLRDQLVGGAAAVLLASAFAVSLRAAVPNLAIGSIAVATGVLAAYLHLEENLQLGAACGVAVGGAAAVGLVLGLVVVVLRVPGWAVSLAAVALLAAAMTGLTDAQGLIVDDGPDLRRWAWALYGGSALLSIAGAALVLNPRFRTAVSRYRTNLDPAARRGGPAGVAVVLALLLSGLLAAAAGLVLMFRQRSAFPADSISSLQTLAALAAPLLGGVSVHGRRGGVFGTVLAASTLQLVLLWLQLRSQAQWVQVLVLGGALVLGLVVSRVVEWLGAPRLPPDLNITMPIPADDPYPTRYADQF